MAAPTVSQYYRKKLEKHELTPEEWSAVRFAVLKHTAIATLTTVTLGSAAFFYARSRAWSRGQSLLVATAGNMIGLGIGGVIAMESGMKTVEERLQGSGSELLYLMDRYSKAALRERLGDQGKEDVSIYNSSPDEKTSSPRMIGVQDDQKE